MYTLRMYVSSKQSFGWFLVSMKLIWQYWSRNKGHPIKLKPIKLLQRFRQEFFQSVFSWNLNTKSKYKAFENLLGLKLFLISYNIFTIVKRYTYAKLGFKGVDAGWGPFAYYGPLTEKHKINTENNLIPRKIHHGNFFYTVSSIISGLWCRNKDILTVLWINRTREPITSNSRWVHNRHQAVS